MPKVMPVYQYCDEEKENYGTNGSYYLTMGYEWYIKPAAGFNLNHWVEKFNLYTDYFFISNQSIQKRRIITK